MKASQEVLLNRRGRYRLHGGLAELEAPDVFLQSRRVVLEKALFHQELQASGTSMASR